MLFNRLAIFVSFLRLLYLTHPHYTVINHLMFNLTYKFCYVFQRRRHGERMHHSHQVLSIPLQPPLLCK